MYLEVNVKELIGKTLKEVRGIEESCVVFETTNGEEYRMSHSQDCCESVGIEDITGDVKDLIGEPILMAEEISNSDNPPENADSFTWTFYKFATIKGYVTFRWLGESNGYYGEGVDFERIK